MSEANVRLVPEGSPEWHQLIADTVKARWDYELPAEPRQWTAGQQLLATLTDRLMQREYEMVRAKGEMADTVLMAYDFMHAKDVDPERLKDAAKRLMTLGATMRRAEVDLATAYSTLVAFALNDQVTEWGKLT